MTTTTEKTLDTIYVEAIAETLDYYVTSARTSKESAQAQIAKGAERVAEGKPVGRSLGSYADDYEVARMTEEKLRDVAAFLATGKRETKDDATPAERISALRKFVEQESDRAFDAIAHGWNSLADPHVRSGAAEIAALRDAERDGWRAAVEAATDEDGFEARENARKAKAKRSEAIQKMNRARNDDRITELQAEIDKLGDAADHFDDRAGVYRAAAEKAVTKAIGGRIFPRSN